MSPFLVARAPYYIKGAELGHSHFYRMVMQIRKRASLTVF